MSTHLPEELFETVLDIDPDLKLDERLVSIHALNPFTPHNSSARSTMMSSHLSQSVPLLNGDEKIIQTGLEYQLAKNTFSIKIEKDCKVLSVIDRYGDMSLGIPYSPSKIIIVQNLEDGEITHYEINTHFSLHQHFGFRYIKNEEVLNKLTYGTILEKGTILADSVNVKNNGYRYGINANVALMSIPDVSEDAVIISESCAKRLAYEIFETKVIEFGTNKFPLNIYGDLDNYKPFPELGEKINANSVVMVLRTLDSDYNIAMLSKKDLMEFNPLFDEAIYVKGPGEDKILDGYVVESGVVIDIKAYYNPKHKKEVPTETVKNIQKYIKGYKDFYTKIIEEYNKIKLQFGNNFKNNNLRLSEKTHRLLVDAYAITDNSGKVKYSFRNELMDIYRIELTIKYTIIPSIGSKISDSHGAKGVITGIFKDEDMPVDEYGNRADIIMDPTSIPARMNIGRLYEQIFNGISRHTKYLVIKELGGNSIKDKIDVNSCSIDKIDRAFDIVLGLLEIIGTAQYDSYLKVKDDINSKKMILQEIVDEELYIHYRISSERKPYQIVRAIWKTIYKPPKTKVSFIYNNNKFVTKDNIRIAPIYVILLSKTPEHMLSVASAKTNHYGIPIGIGNIGKDRLPYRNSPVKTLSETETRLYAAYGVDLSFIAELKHRANSPATHRAIYKAILTAEQPTNIPLLVDRTEVPYGDDSSVVFVSKLFETSGIKINYVPEEMYYDR